MNKTACVLLLALVFLQPYSLWGRDLDLDFRDFNSNPSGSFYNNNDLQRRLDDLNRQVEINAINTVTPPPPVSIQPVVPDVMPVAPAPGFGNSIQPPVLDNTFNQPPVYTPQLVMALPVTEFSDSVKQTPAELPPQSVTVNESRFNAEISRQTFADTVKTFFSAPEKPEGATQMMRVPHPGETLTQQDGPGFRRNEGIEAALQPSASQKLFESVAGGVKSMFTAVTSLAHIVTDGLVHLWDRWILGRKTVTDYTSEDGSHYEGRITLNRDGSLRALTPGTLRTLASSYANVSGSPSKTVEKVTAVGGKLWSEGTFVWDGKDFQLKGQGIQQVHQLEPYQEVIQSGTWLTEVGGISVAGHLLSKVYNGDAQGHNTFLGYQVPEEGTQLEDKNTGLFMESRNNQWLLTPNQAGVIQLQGQAIRVQLDDHGRLEHAVTAHLTINGSEQNVKITGILPNPDTGGYRLIGHIVLDGKDSVRLGIPGEHPSTERSDALMKRQADAVWGVEAQPLKTQAHVQQEGQSYIFSRGDVAVSLVTATGDHGQTLISADPVLPNGTALTVTGKTTFPDYGVTVYAGKASFGPGGTLEFDKSSLYKDAQGIHLGVSNSFSQAVTALQKSYEVENNGVVPVIRNLNVALESLLGATGQSEMEHAGGLQSLDVLHQALQNFKISAAILDEAVQKDDWGTVETALPAWQDRRGQLEGSLQAVENQKDQLQSFVGSLTVLRNAVSDLRPKLVIQPSASAAELNKNLQTFYPHEKYIIAQADQAVMDNLQGLVQAGIVPAVIAAQWGKALNHGEDTIGAAVPKDRKTYIAQESAFAKTNPETEWDYQTQRVENATVVAAWNDFAKEHPQSALGLMALNIATETPRKWIGSAATLGVVAIAPEIAGVSIAAGLVTPKLMAYLGGNAEQQSFAGKTAAFSAGFFAGTEMGQGLISEGVEWTINKVKGSFDSVPFINKTLRSNEGSLFPKGVQEEISEFPSHNVANYAKQKILYKAMEDASPVIESLRQTGELPSNYITKGKAILNGWESGKPLDNYLKGAQVGGDIFKNYEEIVPNVPERIWREADVAVQSSTSRSSQPGTRLLYSNDGLLYITTDHYQSQAHYVGRWK